MRKKYTLAGIIVIVILIIFSLIIFIKKDYKVSNLGNNISNKSNEKIIEYILNMQSYNANITVTVYSNKNTNEYVINQSENIHKSYNQELVKPENLKGLKVVYDGTNLKIENTNLNLRNIYENYTCIANNDLLLSTFIEEYKEEGKLIEENEDEIILEAKSKRSNKYSSSKTLCINKKTSKPTYLEIKNTTQKTTIYILYNEIELNNLKQDVLAFRFLNNKDNI